MSTADPFPFPFPFRTASGARAVAAAYQELLEVALPGAERRSLTTGLGATFAVSAGPAAAAPVVLLHGSGATLLSWAQQIWALARRHRVHAVDLPGEPGRSAPARPPLGTDAYAEWLTEVTDGLEAPRAVLVGTSLGGWFALDYAARRPRRVAGLVLLSPSGIGRRRLGPLLVAALLGTVGEGGRRLALRRLLGLTGDAPADQLSRRQGDLALLTFRHFRPRVDHVPTFDDATLAGLDLPVALVAGARDALLDGPGAARRARRLMPRATVELLPGGHLVPDPTERIEGFLRRLEPAW